MNHFYHRSAAELGRSQVAPSTLRPGPHVQIKLGELASCLKASYDVYRFSSPIAKLSLFCLVAALFLLSAINDSHWYCEDFLPYRQTDYLYSLANIVLVPSISALDLATQLGLCGLGGFYSLGFMFPVSIGDSHSGSKI